MSEPPGGAGLTLAEARAVLATLRPRIDGFLVARADFAELRADLAATGSSPHGALAEVKALEARLHATLEHFASVAVQVKGFAPLLLDLPGDRAGAPTLWCWLEGEADIAWHHRLDTGFAGRRPV